MNYNDINGILNNLELDYSKIQNPKINPNIRLDNKNANNSLKRDLKFHQNERYNFESYNPQRTDFQVVNKKDLKHNNMSNSNGDFIFERNNDSTTMFDSRNFQVNPIVDYNVFSENYKEFKKQKENGFRDEQTRQISDREMVPNIASTVSPYEYEDNLKN